MQETILKINLEAAEEIGRQLRLRNLSGMIIVDFIDMAAEEDRRLLLEHLMAVVSMDPVKTVVVDYTRLNLVEMTRKKYTARCMSRWKIYSLRAIQRNNA